ncbi:MAG: hypothetical protein ABIH38_05070 [Patescibacteria group bacterium]
MDLIYRCNHLAIKLFKIGAILDKSRSPEGKGFKLKLHEKNPEAPLSPIYLNFRTTDHPTKPGPFTPEIIREIGQILYQRSLGLAYDQVAGIPRAGDPLAQVFFEIWRSNSKNPLDCGIIKLDKEESSEKRQVTRIKDGHWNPGEKVLVIDDMVTKADSKLEAIEALERNQLQVRDILVLVDREGGGVDILNAKEYNIHWVFKFTDLLSLYRKEGLITQKAHEEIKDYLRNS